jgi:DNA gyrase subunit A
MSLCYVHGDAAMYDTFIRAAKPFAYRYPIEEAQGAYGTPVAPDDHSASRYVEMRSGEIADYFFEGLKKDAVNEWYWNYDDTEQIPSVLPSVGFWNVVNGCSGIAVAMATSVPQFNLKEVNEALIKIIENPDADFNQIYCAPDFATGGTIINAKEVKESLRYGKGSSIRLKAKLEYFPDQNMIKATELPYGVYTNTVIEQIKSLTEENENYGIERVIDHTKKTADIRIYLTKGTNANRMIAKLYKDTSLENWFAVNMIMLDRGRFPKVFGWREACDAYITHIRECKRREIQFDLDKALARENILNALIVAAANIDEVVAIIRSSSNPSEASNKLIARFNFNEEQTKAILAMKLSALTKVDSIKLNDELEEIRRRIEELQHLLNTPSALDAELIKILREVANKFGDERRTKILNVKEETDDEEEIQEDDVTVMLFDNNSIRVIKSEDFNGGKRGRKGVNLKPPKNAQLINTLYSTNLGSIAAFTSFGRSYSFSLSDLEYNKDYFVYELIQLQDNEKVLTLIDSGSFSNYNYITFVTREGLIKRSRTGDHNLNAKKGQVAIKLKEEDSLVNVFLSSTSDDKVMIGSNSGRYVFYPISEITTTGRNSSGVKAIKLEKKEFVVSATMVKTNISYSGILTITTEGRGKISPLNEYSETSRAVKGNLVQKVDAEEKLALIYAVPESQDKIHIIADNKLVTLSAKEIPIQNRVTSGVRVIDIRNVEAKVEVI